MPATRPIEREPASSDERTENAIFRRRVRAYKVVGAERVAKNSLGAQISGRRVRGGLVGGNPGPVGVSTANPRFD
jgi:hypothetical protein